MHFRPVSNPSFTTSHYSSNHQSPSSVVIEHIRPSEKSREFLLELLTYTNTPTYALSSYNFVGSTVIMFFNTPSQCSYFYSKIPFIRSNSIYNHLYIRAERFNTERTRGRVLFHALQSNLAPSNIKCTFNNFTNSFQLRHITNSNIDWNNNPIYISNDTYNTWSTSYNTYKLHIKSLNSLISDSQSSHQSAQLPSTTRPNYLRTISIRSTSIDTALSILPFIHITSQSQINAAILNVSSIRNKVDHSLDLFNDLICLTETWLKDNDIAISASLNINNLSFSQLNRLGPHLGGGVGILYNTNINLINSTDLAL